MTTTSFDISNDSGISTLTLNNPERHNALDASFWNKFPQIIEKLHDDKTRVLVITANGKSFCSGIDISMFSDPKLFALENPISRERFLNLVELMQNVFDSIRTARFPVIAAIQGPCIGAGLDLVSACDMRYTTPEAYFRLAEINLGLMADLGTLQLLPESLPAAIVNELAYTGRDFLPDQAKSLGYINDIFKDEDEMRKKVNDIASVIASKAPLAVHQTKMSLKYRQEGHGIKDAMKHAALLQSAFMDVEAIRGSFAKEVTYKDLEPRVDSV